VRPASTCAAARLEHAAEQLGSPVPQDLDTDAEQQEGGEPHHDAGAGGADDVGEPCRVPVGHVDQEREQRHRCEGLQEEFEGRRVEAVRAAGADGNGDRDGAGARGEGHRERIEGEPRGRYRAPVRVRGFAAALLRGIRLVEHAPARHRHHDAAGHPQNRNRNSEEAEHVRAHVERCRHDAERIDRHPQRHLLADLLVDPEGCAEKNERPGQRIDDGDQGSESEQEGGEH
jgi:hypothetical protein